MSSQAKIEANRANAAKSTGPRSPEGKAASRMNAVKHGLTAATVLMPHEDAKAYKAFRAQMLDSLRPVGAVEGLFADRVVAIAWRLTRACRAEMELLESAADRVEQRKAICGSLFAMTGTAEEAEPTKELRVGRAFAWLAANSDTLGRFSRYETALERAFRGTLHELQRLQAARAGQPVPPPVAVDVNINGGFVSQFQPRPPAPIVSEEEILPP